VLTILLTTGALLPAAGAAATSKGGIELKATLTGKSEAPKPGDPKGRGDAELKLAGTSVCWEIHVAGIGRPLAAHVHRGGPGKAGPVVVPLGSAFREKGCVRTSAALARALAARSSAYYVNVHTKRYPGGALRGQLQPDEAESASGSDGYGGYGRG
jgi:hypothetical protein